MLLLLSFIIMFKTGTQPKCFHLASNSIILYDLTHEQAWFDGKQLQTWKHTIECGVTVRYVSQVIVKTGTQPNCFHMATNSITGKHWSRHVSDFN